MTGDKNNHIEKADLLSDGLARLNQSYRGISIELKWFHNGKQSKVEDLRPLLFFSSGHFRPIRVHENIQRLNSLAVMLPPTGPDVLSD